MNIIGAGLSGLILASIFPNAQVFEREPGPKEKHRALLRFRSDAVARATGIDFQRVMVRKGIWYSGEFARPDIRLANWYSQKCLHGLIGGERSIWNIEPVERWIAPPDFYHQLIDRHEPRINFGTDIRWPFRVAPIINTTPLINVCRELGVGANLTFARSPVYVLRGKLSGVSDIYQTVYYPSLETPLYRASITGDTLICEFTEMPAHPSWVGLVAQAFGLSDRDEIAEMESPSAQYGKIVPLPTKERRAVLSYLTEQHGIYSVGRYATWRNILLDDVVSDAMRVRELMAVGDYERKIMISKTGAQK